MTLVFSLNNFITPSNTINFSVGITYAGLESEAYGGGL